MERRIFPAKSITGGLRLPGDKSISHRYALLGAMAEGETAIRNYAPGADCTSTLRCLESLGVSMTSRVVEAPSGERVEEIVLQGRGRGGLQAPQRKLDAGNSGSTLRMLSGLVAGHPFRSVLTGDDSLCRRPMKRIIEPLERMGAAIQARDGNFPPLEIQGARLRAIEYRLPVASAQVKSAVLLAGLLAEGKTTVEEPVATRDHTEIALAQFGAAVARKRRSTSVEGQRPLQGQKLAVPGDISSAAFFICAALLFPASNLYLQDVGLNPTRTALLDLLCSMGAQVKVLNVEEVSGELVGDIHVAGGSLRGGWMIEGKAIPFLIDEIPVLAVLGTQTEEGLVIRHAEELRLKESDRIATVAENLRRMGAMVQEHPDGLEIAGRQRLRGAELDSFGDHRIAMAFTVAALAAKGESLLHNSEAAGVSFPNFFEQLEKVVER
ncbi:MAG: 3-phosphoshikimate 1-carboxyvinyltransferase [Acidobacteria bacterium]|nr:3-phosphoshikimate 1-carboxyvinyltransferase [Acidobacteriota bacterium]